MSAVFEVRAADVSGDDGSDRGPLPRTRFQSSADHRAIAQSSLPSGTAVVG